MNTENLLIILDVLGQDIKTHRKNNESLVELVKSISAKKTRKTKESFKKEG